MKNENFRKYIDDVGIKDDKIISRIEDFYEFCKFICPELPDTIFISEYLTKEGKRIYENLWFFSKHYMMEAKEFISQEEYDIVFVSHNIKHFSIEKENFNFNQSPTEESRLYVKFSMTTDLYGELKASKENCDSLKKIIEEFVKPNLLQLSKAV